MGCREFSPNRGRASRDRRPGRRCYIDRLMARTAVTVETASALDETSKAEIEAALGRAKKRANFRVVPELVTGLRITTEEGLIDASVSGLASFAEQFLNTEIDRMLSEESMD